MRSSGEKFPVRPPLLGFLGGVAAFPVCFAAAAFFSDGGLEPTPLTVVFPYAMLWGFGSSGVVGQALMSLQFPLYGLAAGLVRADDRARWLLIALAAAHLLAAFGGVAFYSHTPEGLTTLPPGLDTVSHP